MLQWYPRRSFSYIFDSLNRLLSWPIQGRMVQTNLYVLDTVLPKECLEILACKRAANIGDQQLGESEYGKGRLHHLYIHQDEKRVFKKRLRGWHSHHEHSIKVAQASPKVAKA